MPGLWAVDGDKESHGNGALKASTGDSSPGTVFINNKPVIVGTTDADPDDKAPAEKGEHQNPKSQGTFATVLAYNKPAHTNGDTRTCGATTIVSGQSNVHVGD